MVVCLQCRRPEFDPWFGKIPWRKEQLLTPVFLPGQFHEELAGAWQDTVYGVARVRQDWTTKAFTFFSPLICITLVLINVKNKAAALSEYLQTAYKQVQSRFSFCKCQTEKIFPLFTISSVKTIFLLYVRKVSTHNSTSCVSEFITIFKDFLFDNKSVNNTAVQTLIQSICN